MADVLSRFPVGPPEETDPTKRMVYAFVGSYHPPNDVALLQQGDRSLKYIPSARFSRRQHIYAV